MISDCFAASESARARTSAADTASRPSVSCWPNAAHSRAHPSRPLRGSIVSTRTPVPPPASWLRPRAEQPNNEAARSSLVAVTVQATSTFADSNRLATNRASQGMIEIIGPARVRLVHAPVSGAKLARSSREASLDCTLLRALTPFVHGRVRGHKQSTEKARGVGVEGHAMLEMDVHREAVERHQHDACDDVAFGLRD